METKSENSLHGAGIVETSALKMAIDQATVPMPANPVVEENVLVIDIEGLGNYALMWTPTEAFAGAVGYTAEDGVLADADIPEALALAAGFAFTEGIVTRLADISAMWICAERPDVVNIRLKHPEAAAVRRRNAVINSSCAVCGGWEQIIDGINARRPTSRLLRLTVAELANIRSQMQARQRVFAGTGGTHGAALFDVNHQILAVAEDLGRHNALDKVIGYQFLSGKSFKGCGAFISSRISYEMAAKAAVAGLELLAAISAPSSLAIKVAERHDLTLCGFVRGDQATVFTGPERLHPDQ